MLLALLIFGWLMVQFGQEAERDGEVSGFTFFASLLVGVLIVGHYS